MLVFLEFVSSTKGKKDNNLNAVNELDLADALEKLKLNDPNLTSLNVNNHKDINDLNAIQRIIECLPDNTNLKILCMANTQMHDRHAKVRSMIYKTAYSYCMHMAEPLMLLKIIQKNILGEYNLVMYLKIWSDNFTFCAC